MKDIGKGIAVAGIWLGVGIASLSGTDYIGLVAVCAACATVFGLLVWE